MKKVITAALLGTLLASPSYSEEAPDATKREQCHQRMEERLKEVDTNGDKQISESEFLAQAKKRFQKMDADGNGQITREEHKAMREKWRKEHPGGRHGSHHGDDAPAEGK